MADRSEWWGHFIKIKDINDVVIAARCKYCSRQVKAETDRHGTSGMKRHFNVCKRNPHKFNKDSTQGTIQATYGGGVGTWKFDPDAIRTTFTEMIIVDELPFAFVDNASSNDSGIVYLRRHLNKSPSNIAKGKYLHMRCAAHIVNLIVQDGLKEVDLSIQRVRAVVRYIRNGGTRITKFKEIVVEEKVDAKAFLRIDVPTRWNSTFLMLDKYLAEDTEDVEMKLDIFAWWKINESRFLVLAHLARDALAIPISSVASESAFSTSGRILDDFRTSLTPFMLEALVCGQDWLRRTTPIDIQESMEELAVGACVLVLLEVEAVDLLLTEDWSWTWPCCSLAACAATICSVGLIL
ncbi:hypothetical protein ACQ4PT_028030 [Festuca glaucescens]